MNETMTNATGNDKVAGILYLIKVICELLFDMPMCDRAMDAIISYATVTTCAYRDKPRASRVATREIGIGHRR